ncbi:MAG: phenylalanine--tRNA ligase subunit beta [Prolixibacteraceae bacterium]|jgi:phenylalanyl-tRNA synthetase beta chain|nr:phenylalanine--tRNA ligase subunit beta [Prolixibacteraceae bacterium]
MEISYNWLKDYLDFDYSAHELGNILTQIGLEVGSVEKIETIKGGLQGLVIGEVITCEKHPNSDHLSKTTVNIGKEVLPIVCGAPNVAAGQKVVVATIGTKLYNGDQEFEIKKSKIRGELSEGMICAEDEIGLGASHDGIMVLPDDAIAGTPARDFFKVESDYMIEVDLTPNRVDASSHIGVARDLAAFMSRKNPVGYKKPSVENFKTDNTTVTIPVEVLNPEACPRFTGLTITGLTIAESPGWLKNRLKAIGQKSINNVVDITNYVLMETGQPLHAYDLADVKGNKIIVRTMPAGTQFTTLDGIERELHPDDLMVCNTDDGMCIGGVFGGLHSGVKETTKGIFLEAAYFDPISIRKTARRHGLSTDASFRFERGIDPNNVLYSLKRAAMLIKEIAGGKISSEIVDIYPEPVNDFEVDLSYHNIHRLIGKKIQKEEIKSILGSLEIKIEEETETGLSLRIPPYRVDVKREADIIEDILRIYGYNNVEIPVSVNASLQYLAKPDPHAIRNLISEMLTAQGFNEIWSNSLTKLSYYENNESFAPKSTVKIFNPLSNDLGGMRQTLLYGGLEAIAYNANRRNADLKLYEFGNCYFHNDSELKENPISNYREEEQLALFVSGSRQAENWAAPQTKTSFFELKSYVENILKRLGFAFAKLKVEETSAKYLSEGLVYSINNKKLVEFGIVATKIQQQFEIENQVYYAGFVFDNLLLESKNKKVAFSGIPKYPEVRRDLALLIDRQVKFSSLKDIAFRTEKTLLRSVGLFDVYEGKGVPEGKKSYALSFILRDDEKTLNDKQIDKIMQRLIMAFERELDAKLR